MGKKKKELPGLDPDIDKLETILLEPPNRQQEEDNSKASNDEKREVDRKADRPLLPVAEAEEPSKVRNPTEVGDKMESDEAGRMGKVQGKIYIG